MIGSYKVPIWCIVPKDGSDAWIVIQKRGQFGNDPRMFTEKKWKDYVKYFGEPDKEYWIGLENMSQLTAHSGDWVLDVSLWCYKSSIYLKK